MKKLGKFIVPH